MSKDRDIDLGKDPALGVRRDATRDVLAGELDSPAWLLALVKINAATSKKMTKTRNYNPLYQVEL